MKHLASFATIIILLSGLFSCSLINNKSNETDIQAEVDSLNKHLPLSLDVLKDLVEVRYEADSARLIAIFDVSDSAFYWQKKLPKALSTDNYMVHIMSQNHLKELMKEHHLNLRAIYKSTGLKDSIPDSLIIDLPYERMAAIDKDILAGTQPQYSYLTFLKEGLEGESFDMLDFWGPSKGILKQMVRCSDDNIIIDVYFSTTSPIPSYKMSASELQQLKTTMLNDYEPSTCDQVLADEDVNYIFNLYDAKGHLYGSITQNIKESIKYNKDKKYKEEQKEAVKRWKAAQARKNKNNN